MKRAWIAVLAVALLAMPAVAYGNDGSQSSRENASKVCKALRAQMGTELFRQTYGTNENRRNAHGKCVSKHRHAVKQLIAQAVRECKEELATQQVEDKPGRSERRALRECVKQKLRTLLAERREDFENAARECQAERKADPAAFREKYGTNENKRNAFGKCVVQTVRANKAEEGA